MNTEEKIVSAALRQFETHGFMAATTKGIAADAGVAEVTLFRYFGDKRTLFAKAADRVAQEFGLMDIPNNASGDIRQDVNRLCQGLLLHFIHHNSLIRMLVFEVKKYADVKTVLMHIRAQAMHNIWLLVSHYDPKAAENKLSDTMEWLLNSLIGASLCYCLFHDQENQQVYAAKQAGLIANAFCDCL